MAYATVADLQRHMVYDMSEHEKHIAETLLEDASNKLDMEYKRHHKCPDLNDECTEYALMRITCALVARNISTNMQTDEYTYQNNMGAGGFYQSSSFYDGQGMLKLSMEERRELGLPLRVSRAGMVEING